MIVTGCTTTKWCPHCGWNNTCDSSGKAGTLDFERKTAYVWGPCNEGQRYCAYCKGDLMPYLDQVRPVEIKQSDFLEQANLLTRLDGSTREKAFAHLVEEVGEIGTCLAGRKEVDEPIINECVDVINCALEVFFLSGGTIEQFHKLIEEKQGKWRTNICF